ncbi:hypothetical protein FACS1894170_00680 [Planctomycetales bacterium]|nr:hypothetical protein FACS1894170_00680 [Planctomycetales bacterium]
MVEMEIRHSFYPPATARQVIRGCQEKNKTNNIVAAENFTTPFFSGYDIIGVYVMFARFWNAQSKEGNRTGGVARSVSD